MGKRKAVNKKNAKYTVIESIKGIGSVIGGRLRLARITTAKGLKMKAIRLGKIAFRKWMITEVNISSRLANRIYTEFDLKAKSKKAKKCENVSTSTDETIENNSVNLTPICSNITEKDKELDIVVPTPVADFKDDSTTSPPADIDMSGDNSVDCIVIELNDKEFIRNVASQICKMPVKRVKSSRDYSKVHW